MSVWGFGARIRAACWTSGLLVVLQCDMFHCRSVLVFAICSVVVY